MIKHIKVLLRARGEMSCVELYHRLSEMGCGESLPAVTIACLTMWRQGVVTEGRSGYRLNQ